MKLALGFVCLVLSSNFSSTAVQPPVANIEQQRIMTEEEQRFVDHVNAERWNLGMRTLETDRLLVQVAREHSREMAEKDYFDHYSKTPGKRTALDRYIMGLGRRPQRASVGENIFYCSIVDVNRGHEAFMKSPSHRVNILNSKFEKIGVGVYKDESGQFWVTEMFASVRD